jgi:hypothetical protein
VVSFTLQLLYSWRKISGTHGIGCWVGTRNGVDDIEKRIFLPLLGLEI